MPLKQSASKKAMGQNIETEMHAGKPQKQSIAIAYAVQRKNKRKKMADGGQIDEDDAAHSPHSRMGDQGDQEHPIEHDDTRMGNAPGQIDEDDDAHNPPHQPMPSHSHNDPDAPATDFHLDDMRDYSIADAIFEKRKRMAAGGMAMEDELHMRHARERGMSQDHASHSDEDGMVDLNRNSREDLNNEDDMSFDAGLAEQFDDSQIGKQPKDSNMHGYDIPDEDEHDMVEAIRRKMKSRM